MHTYIFKRILLILPTLLLVSILVFSLLRIIPGDAALMQAVGGIEVQGSPEIYEALRHKLGIDRPYYIQYVDWIWRIVRYGDMGTSFYSKRPVLSEILERFPVTLELAVGAATVALLIALPSGVISAIRQDRQVDYLARLLAILGISIPGFWLGTLLIIFPALWFGYLPPMGYLSPFEDLWANVRQFAFPWLVMGAIYAGTAMRMTRSQMLEVLRQDYIRTAWAKGLRERAVIYRHALKNAMIPVLTIVGIDFAYLLGGTVIIETVFVLPGLGSFMLRAVFARDYPQIQGGVLFIATTFVLINLLVDVMYAWFNPKIRYQ